MSLSQDKKTKKTPEEKQTNRDKKRRKKESGQSKKQKKKESKKQACTRRTEEKRNERIQQKLDHLNREKNTIHEFGKQLFGWLSSGEINDIASISGYTKKSNQKLVPVAFLLVLVFASFGNGAITQNALSLQLVAWFKISVTAQAVCLRLGNIETVNFLREIFTQVIQRQLTHGFKGGYAETFHMFKDVILEDSTQIKLHEKLAADFKGCGGSASSSFMKLNVCMSVIYNNIINIAIVAGSIPDQSFFSKSTRKYIKEGELWIRDLGYFNVSEMSIIDKIKAFFLSRLKKDTNVYLNYHDVNQINIYDFLAIRTRCGQVIDQIVYLGVLKLKVRLIGEKVPEYVRKQRIARYTKERIKRDKSKTMKADYFDWFSYSLFVTNVPESMIATPSLMMNVYKIRWQIELFFKRIKSILNIHIIKGESKKRVLCLIYSKLIALLTAQSVVAYAASICQEGEEVSEHKVFEWMQSGNRLGNFIIQGQGIEVLLSELIRVFYLLCKNKRKKCSTQQMIKDSFIEDTLNRCIEKSAVGF